MFDPSWNRLREIFPWPARPPEVAPRLPPRPGAGWLRPETRAILRSLVAPGKVVLELGSWLGLSARTLASDADANVVCVDHWLGSPEHEEMPECRALLPVLFETFCRNCWSLRERIIPVRQRTTVAMPYLHSLGLAPDVIYVDAGHDAESVRADVLTAGQLWPHAQICGDDWDWEGVRQGADAAAQALGRSAMGNASGWRLVERSEAEAWSI